MRPLRLLITIALLVAGLLSLFGLGQAQAAVSYSADEIAFVQLLNDYRLSQGVPALLVSDTLSEAGDRHNSDMAKYRFFDHYTKGSDWFPYNATPWDRMAASGYTDANYRGENIAAGHPTADDVFAAWKASSGHRANMLDSHFKVCGVSLVYLSSSQYGSYWTTDFGDYVDVTAHPLTVPEPTIPYVQLRGSDRFDTAIKISQEMFPGPLPADSGLVLAPGETFQEALCGAPLAAAYGGPVLLTPTAGLNNAVRDEIMRLAPRYVICIGLSGSIERAVQAALGANGTATAITGASVYDMSRQVAAALAYKVDGLRDATAIITRGDVFPDAISVSPLACAQRWPILLTGPTGALNASAVQALDELEDPKGPQSRHLRRPARQCAGSRESLWERSLLHQPERRRVEQGHGGPGLLPHGACYGRQVSRRPGGRALPSPGPRDPSPQPVQRALARINRRRDHCKPGCDAAVLVHRRHRAGAVTDQGAAALDEDRRWTPATEWSVGAGAEKMPP